MSSVKESLVQHRTIKFRERERKLDIGCSLDVSAFHLVGVSILQQVLDSR